MALAANESLSGGFVRLADGSLSVVTSGGVAFSGGYLRDADGRLVMATSGALAPSGGFVRDANGALVVSTTEAGALASGGQLRDAAQNLVVATGGGQAPSGGFLRDAAGASVVTGLSTPQIVLTPVGSDNFNRANGTIAGSNNWLATFDGSMAISSNEAIGTAAVLRGDYRSEVYTADQYATCTIGSLLNVSGAFIGLTLRNSASGNDNYAALYFDNAGTPEIDIYKRTAAGAYVLLATVIPATPLVQGDTMTFAAQGSRLTIYINGVGFESIVDTTIAGGPGAPGIVSFGVVTLDNFVAGNVTTGPLGAATATDPFTRANGGVAVGQANWSSLAGVTFTGTAAVDAQIVSNQIAASSGFHAADVRTDAFSADHWAAVQQGLTPLVSGSGGFLGGLTRMNAGGGTLNSGYLGLMFFTATRASPGGGANCNLSYRIYRLDNGVSTLLAECSTLSTGDPTGTQYALVSKGSRQSLRITPAGGGTPVEVLAVTDATYPTGKPGHMYYPTVTADNWSAGNV